MIQNVTSKIYHGLNHLKIVKHIRKRIFEKIEHSVNEKLEIAAKKNLPQQEVLQMKLNALEQRIYRGVEDTHRDYTQLSDLMYTRQGLLRSTKSLSAELKFDANMFFQIQEKAKVALTACSIWHGGDYFEFGSTDMQTFRNFLSACDIFDLKTKFPEMQFYAFDIFGEMKDDHQQFESVLNESTMTAEMKQGYTQYFSNFKKRGDLYEENINFVKEHGLYVDDCHLVQGYFQHTLNQQLKAELKQQNRGIGFAFIDVNDAASYKIVFEFIFDLMLPQSYIYMDEYYASTILTYFEQFAEALKNKRKIIARFVCKAGGFGALFFLCHDYDPTVPQLDLNVT